MRAFLGIICTIIVLTGAILTILALWGIQPISWALIWKSGVTIIIIGIVSLVIYLFYYLFFKNYTIKKNNNRQL